MKQNKRRIQVRSYHTNAPERGPLALSPKIIDFMRASFIWSSLSDTLKNQKKFGTHFYLYNKRFSPAFYCLFGILLFVLIFSRIIYAQEINNLDVKIKGEELIVSISIILHEEFINEVKNGIQKELIFYIDLFRVWKFWPDEYVYGNSIVRKIVGDVIKGEYIMSSFDRNKKVIIEKKFKSLESMLKAMAEIGPISLINIKGMESGDYYVRVTVESRLRKLPPVVGYILFFIPEKEFSITKDSPIFRLGSR